MNLILETMADVEKVFPDCHPTLGSNVKVRTEQVFLKNGALYRYSDKLHQLKPELTRSGQNVGQILYINQIRPTSTT